MNRLTIYLLLHLLIFNAEATLMSETSLTDIANEVKAGARIGVFIGSFDPLHTSHEKLIQKVLDDNLVDFLIVGANDNMTHKPNASSWAARNSFLASVYQDHPKVLIADDLNFGFPITGNTVHKIRELRKDTKVFTIIGNDIATMPHLYEDVPKMTFENGGQIDTWLVNVSRPELNRSTAVPPHIAHIPVLTFNSESGYSSSTIRKNEGMLRDPKYTNPKVFAEIQRRQLYGASAVSCSKIL